MGKKYFVTCLLLVLCSFCLTSVALAAPTAYLSMHIADWEQIGDVVEFNVIIDIGKPSEPYASLDFNIVSSSKEHLSIVDLSEAGDESRLAFDFSPDYGGAYHKGRLDEANGSVSYLAGIFSQNSGNNITAETNICTVKFRYTGNLEQELSLENLKLIYKNSDGKITSVAPEGNISKNISPADFVQSSDRTSPLSGNIITPIVYVLVASVTLIVVFVVFRKWQGGKRKSA